MYVTNALMAVRERPSTRIAGLRFYLSTSTREKRYPNPVVFKTVILSVSEDIHYIQNEVS